MRKLFLKNNELEIIMRLALIALPLVSSCSDSLGSHVDSDSQGTDSGSGSEALSDYLSTGFVAVDAGTFFLGSPETEVAESLGCRGAYTETQVEVTLTHRYEIAKTEVTQAQWKSAGFPNPVASNEEFYVVLDDSKPVSLVDWYEALAFCNALSEKAGLETCYDLSHCTGDAIGSGCPKPNPYATWENGACGAAEGADPYDCGFPVRKYASMYDCKGYRLPTSAEWEYAARAGTTGATYNGEIQNGYDQCYLEPALEPIAWYCKNTTNHEFERVGMKQPNAWGLYDMLGNAREWTDAFYTGCGLFEEEHYYDPDVVPPLVDPMGQKDNGTVLERITRGGLMSLPGCTVRAAKVYGGSDNQKRDILVGFRPARTLFDDERK